MLFWITGQPGHRKTAYAITKALEYKAAGRRVFAQSIEDPNQPGKWLGVRRLDFDATGFERLDDPTQWESLPDGSVVLLDEAYVTFPRRAPGKPVPPHVEAMARHRHRGFDFIIVGQKHDQFDSFIMGLVEQHTHVIKKLVGSQLRRFDRAVTNPHRDCGDVVRFMAPSRVFDYYEHATEDTSKKRVPSWMIYAGIGVAFIAWGTMYVRAKFQPQATPKAVAAVNTPRSGGVAGASAASDKLRDTDYNAWMKPRIEGKPWTAPAFDGLSSSAAPDLYCMASDTSCTCLTEQGTKYRLAYDLCRTIAREGNYNPTRKPASSGGRPEYVAKVAPYEGEPSREWGDNFTTPPPPPPGVYRDQGWPDVAR